MNDTFSVNISSTSEVSAVVGSNISLLCEANMDAASITWFFNSSPIKVNLSSISVTCDGKISMCNSLRIKTVVKIQVM